MSRHGPPRAGGAVKSASGSLTVETQAKQTKGRRRGKRGTGTAQRIHRTARARQDAWAEGGQPNRTYTLTRELGDLYDTHRSEQAGTLTDPVRRGDPARQVAR